MGNNVIVKENAPILIHNEDHKNYIYSDKLIPKGTVLQGDFVQINGLRRGKNFEYRFFKDKDGILIHENKVEKMEYMKSNAEGERIINLPSVKRNTRTHTLYAVGASVVAFAVSKKMGYSNKKSFIIAGVTALIGYGVASMLRGKDDITYTQK